MESAASRVEEQPALTEEQVLKKQKSEKYARELLVQSRLIEDLSAALGVDSYEFSLQWSALFAKSVRRLFDVVGSEHTYTIMKEFQISLALHAHNNKYFHGEYGRKVPMKDIVESMRMLPPTEEVTEDGCRIRITAKIPHVEQKEFHEAYVEIIASKAAILYKLNAFPASRPPEEKKVEIQELQAA